MSAEGGGGGEAGFVGPVSRRVAQKLEAAFRPAHLEVRNESHMHCVPKDSETHFKVVVVSDAFEGLALLKRHVAVNDALKEELQGGVHALSIVARTPAQWEKGGGRVKPSPACLGGANK